MKRISPIEGYTYELLRADVESLPEFNSLTESDFIEFKPSIFILKSGYRKNKVFSAFFQIETLNTSLLQIFSLVWASDELN